jgi:hypothetical protein
MHAAGVVHHSLLFADDLQLAQKDPMVAQEEQNSEKMFEDGEDLQCFAGRREWFFEQLASLLANLSGMLERAQKA